MDRLLSTVNRPLSTVNRQPSTVNRQPSTVNCYNPSSSQGPTEMAIAEVPVAAGEGDLVLAVDDNEQNWQLLEESLWSWGYDVVVARDGREALQLYPQHNPSIIVLDVMMPNMDGYEACTLIKGEPGGRRIPILMLTALTGTEDKIKALECGADDFLNKPINPQELRTRLRSLIKIRNPLTALHP